MNKRTSQGFTLIEYLIVVAIIGILAAIVAKTVQEHQRAPVQTTQESQSDRWQSEKSITIRAEDGTRVTVKCPCTMEIN